LCKQNMSWAPKHSLEGIAREEEVRGRKKEGWGAVEKLSLLFPPALNSPVFHFQTCVSVFKGRSKTRVVVVKKETKKG